ncbi:hypothetical protein [Absidia glauca]|uniref:DH domain-containing protein n=1 Tax=Absidia glauca TaxID=4829 RepID=A0A168NA30_ABSGL|nr:hypothetical protein [Absidia glauca]
MTASSLQGRPSSIEVMSTTSTPLAASATSSSRTAALGVSLYHTCRLVLDKFALVEGMSYWLDLQEDTLSPSLTPISTVSPPLMPLSTSSPVLMATNTSSPDPPTTSSNDPLARLCCLCRRGAPLFTLFNALHTKQPLKIDPNPKLNQLNNCKASVYHFLVACRQQLLFPEEELFAVSDLYVDDTNGFVKVVNTVHKILQLLEDKGLISSPSSYCPSSASSSLAKDTRDQVVLELLSTERKYVQDLEILQNYMRDLQHQRILCQDTVHYLFGNLNALVDFQRRFLIEMEKTAENLPQEQHFGLLFCQMEDAFSVYEPYCSNFYSAQDLVVQEAPNLQKLNMANPTHELTSLLIKPIQRICKYPLLLNELVKNTNKAWPTWSDLSLGMDAMRRVADKVNETQRKHENFQMVMELKQRVDHWKGISIDKCGQLLLQDKLLVVVYGNEMETHVFFFENHLLLCKDTTHKTRLAKSATISIKKQQRQQQRRANTLEPKGMIATSMIVALQDASAEGKPHAMIASHAMPYNTWIVNTHTHSLSLYLYYGCVGELALTIQWREQDLQQFTLKFRNEEQYQLWKSTLGKQQDDHHYAPSSPLITSVSDVSTINPLLSPPLPSSRSRSANPHTWSFIDIDDDEEDEVDDAIYGDAEESGSGTSSRSNSFSEQQINVTDNSLTGGRSNRPGLNLHPLPRSTAAIHSQTLYVSGDSHISYYPSSPPPSNPSSPTSLSRVSPNNSASGRSFRDMPTSPPLHHHHHHHHQKHHQPMSREPLTTPIKDVFFEDPSTRSRTKSNPSIRPPPMALFDSSIHHCLTDKSSSASLQSHLDRALLAAASSSLHSPGHLKIKMIYNQDTYSLVIPQHISYTDLMGRVEQKLHVVGDLRSTSPRLKYQDEDGDFITINSDDDIQLAFESYNYSNIHLFVCLSH